MYLTFSWRYFKAKKSTNAINIIAWVSMSAIIIGTASLIIILSAFNGFESLVKSLYSSFYTDMKMIPRKGKTFLLNADDLKKINSIPGIKNYSLNLEEKALLRNGPLQTVVQIKGVDQHFQDVSGVPKKIFRGSYNIGNVEQPSLVLGIGIENAIGVLSDRAITPLEIYMPKRNSNDLSDPLNALAVAQAYPAGTFAIQQEFDNKYVITNMDFLRQYTGVGADEYSSVEIALESNADIESIRKALSIFEKKTIIQDRYEQNKTLYATIRMEKWAIYAIFSIILLIAAFNMVGALTMLVLEKKKDIQILMSMGADSSMIRKIFLSEGLLLAFIGMSVGMLLAILLYVVQVKYGLVPLQGESFLINHYPVELHISDFVLVGTTVLFIGIIAAWVPAHRAAVQHFELRN
ncbi:MAG: FtsX-like permease family protein [Chitinophagaceae bacterium]